MQILFRNGPNLLIIHIALDEVFVHVELIAGDDTGFVTQVGADDDGEFHLLLFPMPQHRKPIHLRHQEVQEQQVGGVFVQNIDGLLPIQRRADAHAVFAQGLCHHIQQKRFVLCDENVMLLLVHRDEGGEERN